MAARRAARGGCIESWELIPAELRVDLQRFLSQKSGLSPERTPTFVKILKGGTSNGRVFRLSVSQASISYILKIQGSERENFFYRYMAPIWRQQGLGLPYCFLDGEYSEASLGHWLLLEDIPHHVHEDKDRFPYAEEFMHYLRTVHQQAMPMETSMLGKPQWTSGDNQRVIEMIESDHGPQHALRRWLEDQRQQCEARLTVQKLILGDPAIPNWGRRNNGELVKFDWRGISIGDPAMDLAVMLGAFPELEAESDLAASYLGKQANAKAVSELSAKMHLCSLRQVVKFLSAYQRGKNQSQDSWIIELMEDLLAFFSVEAP